MVEEVSRRTLDLDRISDRATRTDDQVRQWKEIRERTVCIVKPEGKAGVLVSRSETPSHETIAWPGRQVPGSSIPAMGLKLR